MEPSNHPDIVPAPNQFAKNDTAEAHDLKQRITTCLKDRFSGLQGIHVTVFGTTVALRGKVSTKDDKRLRLECCRNVPGVTRVVDDLIIADDETPLRPGREEDELS